MTQTISSNKFCPAFNLFLFTFQKNAGFTAVATILALILSPFYLMMLIANMERYFVTELLDFHEIFPMPAFIIAIGACAFFVVLLYMNFSFLYSKVSADAFNSMPISRTGLILSRFFGCVASALIPLIAGYIGFFITANMDGVTSNMGYIWQSFGFSVLMLLFCGSFIFIFVVAGGTVFDSLVSLASVSIGIPIITLLIFGMCEDNLYGCISMDYTLVRFVSPFAFAIIKFSNFIIEPEINTLFDPESLITIIALTVIFFVAGWLLFKFRKAEAASTAFAWKFAPFIIGFVIAFVCYFFMGAIFADERFTPNFWLAGTVGIILGAILYNLVTNRGFKKIKESIAVIVAAIIGVVGMNLIIGLDAFGFESYVPNNSDVKSIKVSYRGMDLEIENTELITKLHQKIVNERPKDTGVPSEYMSISYTLNNGEKVARAYILPYEFEKASKTAIVNHEVSGQLKKDFNSFKGDLLRLSGFFTDGSRYIINLTKTEAAALVEAYAKDLNLVQGNKLFSEEYIDNERINLEGYNTDLASKEEDPIVSSFSFTFRDYEFYENFQNELAKIDLRARNSLTMQTEKY